METYDLIVVGSGTAAYAAAKRAVELGAKVVMVERGTVGGTCINVGCMPSKYLLEIGEHHQYAERDFPGLDIRSSLDFTAAIRGKREYVNRLREKRYTNIVDRLGIPLLQGQASFISETEVSVDGKGIHADRIIIATGSSPQVIPFPGIDQVEILTSEDALDLSSLPESIVVVGGRTLGLEFAQMFHHFGSRVTVLQRSHRILPEEEPAISDHLKRYLEEEGIAIQTGAEIMRVGREHARTIVTASFNGDIQAYGADALLMATGRKPNTENLMLADAGVQTGDRGEILVNNEMQTTSLHIWAAGDVLGEPMLEPVAAKEGIIAAENALHQRKMRMEFLSVPHATFTMPQAASVGLTERAAVERGIPVKCSTITMDMVPKAELMNETQGLVKMVTEEATGRVIGLHILASLAADMIHEGVIAVRYGLTIDDIIDTVHVYPTMTEAVKVVAESFRRDVTLMSGCSE
jgi:mercuric reductase